VDQGLLVEAFQRRLPTFGEAALLPAFAAMKRFVQQRGRQLVTEIMTDAGQSEARQLMAMRRRRPRAAMRTADLQANLEFDATNPEAEQWAAQYAAGLVVEISESTRDMLRSLLQEMFSEQLTPSEVAKMIMPMIGLDSGRAQAVINLRRKIMDSVGNKVWAGSIGIRVPEDVTREFASQKAEQYASRLLRQRATTIARTEAVEISNRGQELLWDQAVKDGFLDPETEEREWFAQPTACKEICEPLDGERAPIGGEYPGGYKGPPGHPNCECTQGIVSVTQ